jgi:hypothetical protein
MFAFAVGHSSGLNGKASESIGLGTRICVDLQSHAAALTVAQRAESLASRIKLPILRLRTANKNHELSIYDPQTLISLLNYEV